MFEISSAVVIFFFAQIINVMLNTGKVLIMAKYDNVHMSVIVNAITFGFYAAVVKMLVGFSFPIVVTVTVITNIIGVYLTYGILAKATKDKLWIIQVYCAGNYKLIEVLEKNNIPHYVENNNMVTIYSYSKEQSRAVKTWIEEQNNPRIKFNVIVAGKSL